MATIIPFGKYKGRTVEQVRASDPGYFDWLAGQQWAAEKFRYLIDEARGGAAPVVSPHDDDSPEHNALQARFLDDKFCLALFMAGNDLSVTGMQKAYAETMENILRDLCVRHFPDFKRAMNQEHVHYGQFWDVYKDKGLIDSYVRWMNKATPMQPHEIVVNTGFEGFTDVSVDLTIQRKNFTLVNLRTYVEIKPSVGDNFPAYIRQIKAQALRGRGPHSQHVPTVVLMYDKFTASLKESQVREMFERSGIPTVRLDEITERLGDVEALIETLNGRH